MNSIERVILWLAIVFLLYQNSNALTEDQVADIATDATTDVLSDKRYVTEEYLLDNFVYKDVLRIDIDRIDEMESQIYDIELSLAHAKSIGDDSYGMAVDLEYRVEELEDRIFTKKEKSAMRAIYAPSAKSIEKIKRYNERIKKENEKRSVNK